MCIRDRIKLVLAREEGKEKIIYASISTGFADVLGAASLYSDKIFVTLPDILFEIILGGVFGKLNNILEAAEKSWLYPGPSHCGLVKTRLGLLKLGLIPKCDLLISFGHFCDEAPKSDELIEKLLGIPVYYTDLSHDRGDDSKEFNRSWEFLSNEVAMCRKEIGKIVGFEINESLLRESRRLRKSYNQAMTEITYLVLKSDPVPLNAFCLILVQFISLMPLGKEALKNATNAAQNLLYELKQRVKNSSFSS